MTQTRDVARRRGSVRRRPLRLVAAALAAAMALIYLLIGFGQVRVVEAAADGTDPGLLAFGLIAGGCFALGAVLTLTVDRRSVWWFGASFQLGAILAYVAVAPQRTPPYEVWGLLLKGGQVALLAAILVLLATAPRPAADAGRRRAAVAAPATAAGGTRRPRRPPR